MAFDKATWCRIASGPVGSVYTYHTSDTVVTPCLVSASTVTQAYLNSTVCTGLAANDMILVSHTGSGSVSQLIRLCLMGVSSSICTASMNV